jgi:hypothetical protein
VAWILFALVVWVLGLIAFLLVALMLLARGVILLLGGDVGRVRGLLGSRSIGEETEEELRELDRRREGA